MCVLVQAHPQVRLNKHLSALGVGSLRKVSRLVSEGRVTVDGESVLCPSAWIDPDAEIRVDGDSPPPGTPHQYVAFHKPEGLLCTKSDPSGRPTIMEAIPVELHHLFPVGRLDKDTSGLLVLTNDGDFAQILTHPRHHVPKTYLVEPERAVTEADLDRLRAGLQLKDGPTRPAEAALLPYGPTSVRVQITITEGRRRQVRRMFRALGNRVKSLVRVAVGPVQLGDLEPGAYRMLNRSEIASLRGASERPDLDRAPGKDV